MRRRDLLKGGLLLPYFAFGEIAVSQVSRAAAPAGRYIDVHCHTFNANDLPAEAFLEKVVVRGKIEQLRRSVPFVARILNRYSNIIEVVIDVLASTIKEAAPSPADEMAFLDGLESHHRTAPTKAERRTKDLQLIKRILEIIWDTSLLRRKLTNRTLASDFLLGEYAMQIQYMVRREARSLLSENPGQADQNLYPPGPDNLDELADLLYGSLGPLGHVLRWLLLFTRYRFELVDMLASIDSPTVAPRLLTPALVDFEFWIVDIPRRSPPRPRSASIASQVQVQSRISRRRGGVHVHGYVAFDPLHQCLYEDGSIHDDGSKSPFDIVKSAILESGFIGVKLYPPMGFRPYGNNSASLPRPVVDRYVLPADYGARLDRALLNLYVWCRDNGVPILAHAHNSYEPYPGGGADADPDLWESVLLKSDAQGRNFLSLRLNLAHMGGFRQTIEKGLPKTRSWEWKLGRIRKSHPTAQVFGDLSYFRELIPIPNRSDLNTADRAALQRQQEQFASTRSAVQSLFREFKAAYSDSADFLLFGSDWIMVGVELGTSDQAFPQPVKYKAQVETFLERVGYGPADRQKIMFGNSIRYLGLRSGQPTRLRLEDFCARAGLDVGWLAEFDQ